MQAQAHLPFALQQVGHAGQDINVAALQQGEGGGAAVWLAVVDQLHLACTTTVTMAMTTKMTKTMTTRMRLTTTVPLTLRSCLCQPAGLSRRNLKKHGALLSQEVLAQLEPSRQAGAWHGCI